MAVPSESGGDMLMPALVSGEGPEIDGLELADGGGWEMGGLGHRSSATVIIGAVAETLCKVAVGVLTITGLLSNVTILFKVSTPSQSGPCKAANCSVKVA